MRRLIVATALLVGLLVARPATAGSGDGWNAAQDFGSTGALPAFDAASIRTNTSSTRSVSRFTPGRYTATGITVKELLKTAYGVLVDDQIRGGPPWLATSRFDIQAVAPNAPQERMRSMLRRLLEERFKLNARFITEEMPALLLQLKPHDPRRTLALRIAECQAGVTPPDVAPCDVVLLNDRFIARGVTMRRLADVLSRSPTLIGASRLVIDRTGLTGSFSFEVRFARPPTYGLRISDTHGLPEFATALSEQLGLTLTAARVPAQVLVVHSAALPAPD